MCSSDEPAVACAYFLSKMPSEGIDKNLIIEMNDSGFTFDQIADCLDRIDKQPPDMIESDYRLPI